MPLRESILQLSHHFHIYCRGNEKKEIFFDRADYERFLHRMKEYAKLYKINIVCYCLMPNHFHLLLEQTKKGTISLFMHRLTVSYSMYFNKRYARVGHLFQGRFKAKPILHNEYLLHLSRYIHLNPSKIVNSILQLEKYPWSSYREYVGIAKTSICKNDIILGQLGDDNQYQAYKKFVSLLIPPNELERISNIIIEDE